VLDSIGGQGGNLESTKLFLCHDSLLPLGCGTAVEGVTYAEEYDLWSCTVLFTAQFPSYT